MAVWLTMGVQLEAKWAYIYEIGLPGYMMSMNILYKIRLLFCDEFIQGIILLNAIKYTVCKETVDTLDTLKKWCEKVEIPYSTCIEFITKRDELIENLIRAGLDVFGEESSSLARATEGTIIDIITRLKYCIYDGYRNNLLTERNNKYYTINQLEVTKPSLFNEREELYAKTSQLDFALNAMPKYIVYKKLTMKQNKDSGLYIIGADMISVMDGFVSVEGDHDFAN
jgi:hypothetical protein